MLAPLLANYPPSSDLFRWLHELVNMWEGQDNDYTFWFEGAGMPRRDYRVRVSQHGQKKIEEMVQYAIRCHKNAQPVDLGKMEKGLECAFDVIRTRPHYSKLVLHEVTCFVDYFVDLLDTVGIYGLELTSAGIEALAHLSRAREYVEQLFGNLWKVGELLDELDQMVDGSLLDDADAEENVGATSTLSEWWGFFPEVAPLCVTLHLDVYVQSARSKEEWVEQKLSLLDEEVGSQQDDDNPSIDTAVEAECPSPSTTSHPGMEFADQIDKWSTCAWCSEATR